MNHYITLFVEDELGEWRALFPDAPGCQAKGFSLNDAKFAAAAALLKHLRESKSRAKRPMTLEAVRRNERWFVQNQIDLSKAVISMIQLTA